jgi:hypothetical protein
MRLILRIAGTWLIGLALVLLVIDGTRSLAANVLMFASLDSLWRQLHPDSLAATQGFFGSRMFADLLEVALAQILALPAFAVFGVPGVLLALLGRKPRHDRFVREDQI